LAAAKPAANAPKAKPVAAPVVTLKAIFEQLGATQALPKKQAHGLLADFVATMTTHLKNGDRIRMSGLGILDLEDEPMSLARELKGTPTQFGLTCVCRPHTWLYYPASVGRRSLDDIPRKRLKLKRFLLPLASMKVMHRSHDRKHG
jgi:nucleoid DNA-binding protein